MSTNIFAFEWVYITCKFEPEKFGKELKKWAQKDRENLIPLPDIPEIFLATKDSYGQDNSSYYRNELFQFYNKNFDRLFKTPKEIRLGAFYDYQKLLIDKKSGVLFSRELDDSRIVGTCSNKNKKEFFELEEKLDQYLTKDNKIKLTR